LSELLQNLSDIEKEPWGDAIKAINSTADLDLLKEILAKEIDSGRLYSHNAFYWLDDQIGNRRATLQIKEVQQKHAKTKHNRQC
jgi:hypothetical protein